MYEGEEYSGQQYYGDYDNDGVHFQETYPDMPDSVRVFLNKLHDSIKEGNVADIQVLYENTFPQLSESHFDKTEWPNVKEVKQVVGLSGQDDKDIFLILYNELYYRHIYAHVQPGPKLDHRIASFYNYCDLFNELIHDFTVPLELPDVWLWELIDEFVYQFQNFQRYIARLTDAENLEPPYPVWHIMSILNVLHSLVEISNIKQQLEVSSAGGDPSTVAGAFGSRALYKMLGYFSLIGLLRVHSLQGDYYLAIKALEPIELHKKSEYSHIPACQISTSYYVGFAYMMMRRYSDAIRTFSSILLYIQRTKQLYSARSYQNDQINKQTDNMYHLLAICLVLHPQYIDESIQQVLREKNYHDSMVKMQAGDLETFSNFFIIACPKFVSRCLSYDGNSEPCPKDPIEQQLEVFKDEVRQQIQLPIIRSYLKLYKTLPLEKLLLLKCSQKGDDDEDEQTEADTLLMNLLCFKHKMKNVVWTKGASGLEGKFQSGSELDFFIDNDMIHIADTRVAHRYGDFFIRKILKFAELNRRLHSINIK